MLINILYSIFFFAVDFVIYAVLTKSYKLSRQIVLSVAGLVVVLSMLHLGVSNFLMPFKDFWGILMFSFGLIILHFGGLLQVRAFKKANAYVNSPNKSFSELTLKVFDFMRLKIIYVMIFLYQLLAVWIPEVR